ncbi:hypothetical protein [Methanohalophilus portucalensis]|nr:hypothetical protein [Methanohalophilus portucalensis]OJH49136.1 hypothetical protein MPF_1639 [Methanohalophilus portucalensis FDF-1]
MPVTAEGIPPLPNAFSGNVTLNGNEAPAGTEINAYIDYQNDTNPDGSFIVSTPGYYKLSVQGNSEDHKKDITFIINNSSAVQTAEFNIYSPPPLDLDLSTKGDSIRKSSENSSMFNNITTPEEKELTNNSENNSSSNVSESLDSLSIWLICSLLGVAFVVVKFGRKGGI